MKPPSCISAIIVIGSACLLLGQAALAQDKLIKTNGETQDVKIMNVSGANVQIQVGGGMIGVPLSTISNVIMAPPADVAAATTAFEAKDYPSALTAAKAVVDKYRGLPTDWAQQSTALLGDIYVALNDLPKAEAAYLDYLKVYPGKGSIGTDVGLARIAFAKKDYSKARQKLDPIKEQAMKQVNVPPDLAHAYGRAFYLLGQVEEAQGDSSNALQDYLRTVTWFYQDRLATSAAQERADALRKEHNLTVP